jgi:hypothetical protein
MTGNKLIKVEIATEGIRPSIMPWIVAFRLIIGLRKGSNLSKLLKVAILVMKATRLNKEKKCVNVFSSSLCNPFSSIHHYMLMPSGKGRFFIMSTYRWHTKIYSRLRRVHFQPKILPYALLHRFLSYSI